MQLHPSLTARAPLRPDPDVIGPLWAYYVAQRDAAVREQLVSAYMGFTRMLAAKVYARRVYTEMEFADYLQYATVGLLEALDRFDPARGILFETYAASRITGAMLSGIESSSEIQQQIVARKRVLAERVVSLGGAGTSPAPAAPDDAAGIFAMLAEIAVGLAVGFALEGSGMHQEEHGHTADTSYAGLELKQLQTRVLGAVRALPAAQRQVIESHYLQQMQFEAVATAMTLSRGRIAQIHKQALGSLRVALYRVGGFDVRC